MNVKTYQESLDYLESFIGRVVFEIDPVSVKLHPPLDRMRMLLSFLGNPQDKFKSILVGGTSGKGSTSYLISHTLTNAGYKTGLTLSPHLQKVNERLQINGKEISDLKFVKLTDSMIRTIEEMKKLKVGVPSYFEIIIAMVFKYFADSKVDVAVVEVGMGGEFDATNTLFPLIAVLTNVGLDHTDILGKSISTIAKTKAGIIKKIQHDKRMPIVITGVRQKSVIKIIENKCKDTGSKLHLLKRDFDYKVKKTTSQGSIFDLIFTHGREVKLNDLQLSLLGDYQVENAALAIKTIMELGKFGFRISDNTIRKALSTAFFPGRFEILGCHPEFISGSSPAGDCLQSKEMLNQVQHDKERKLILDGAHNPTKMKAFLASLEKLYPTQNPTSPVRLRSGLQGTRKVFIVGFKFDKEIKKMLSQIVKVADEIIVTEFSAKTDMSLHASAEALMIKDKLLRMKYQGKITAEKDSKIALKKALAIQRFNNLAIEQFSNRTIIVVTGSLYLVGEIRSML